MPNKDINSPRDLVEQLTRLFPAFLHEWDEGASFGYNGDYNFHTVFLTFGPKSHKFLVEGTSDQIREFCTLLNRFVEKGSDFENAVSACFLEHASQLGVRKIIEPYLSTEAKREIR